MRRPSRRAAVALVVAVSAFTAIVAYASSLNVTSTSLQAGAAAVGQACTGPIATSYTTSGVDAGGSPLIQYVDVNPALGVCTANAAPGYTVTIYLEKGTAGAYTVIGTLTATAVTGHGHNLHGNHSRHRSHHRRRLDPSFRLLEREHPRDDTGESERPLQRRARDLLIKRKAGHFRCAGVGS